MSLKTVQLYIPPFGLAHPFEFPSSPEDPCGRLDEFVNELHQAARDMPASDKARKYSLLMHTPSKENWVLVDLKKLTILTRDYVNYLWGTTAAGAGELVQQGSMFLVLPLGSLVVSGETSFFDLMRSIIPDEKGREEFPLNTMAEELQRRLARHDQQCLQCNINLRSSSTSSIRSSTPIPPARKTCEARRMVNIWAIANQFHQPPVPKCVEGGPGGGGCPRVTQKGLYQYRHIMLWIPGLCFPCEVVCLKRSQEFKQQVHSILWYIRWALPQSFNPSAPSSPNPNVNPMINITINDNNANINTNTPPASPTTGEPNWLTHLLFRYISEPSSWVLLQRRWAQNGGNSLIPRSLIDTIDSNITCTAPGTSNGCESYIVLPLKRAGMSGELAGAIEKDGFLGWGRFWAGKRAGFEERRRGDRERERESRLVSPSVSLYSLPTADPGAGVIRIGRASEEGDGEGAGMSGFEGEPSGEGSVRSVVSVLSGASGASSEMVRLRGGRRRRRFVGIKELQQKVVGDAVRGGEVEIVSDAGGERDAQGIEGESVNGDGNGEEGVRAHMHRHSHRHGHPMSDDDERTVAGTPDPELLLSKC